MWHAIYEVLVAQHARTFAEVSRVPPNLAHRTLAVPGVQNAREFVYHTIQRERDKSSLDRYTLAQLLKTR